MSKLDMAVAFDPAIIVQKQQAASMFRGREGSPEHRAAQNEIVLSVYQKPNGDHVFGNRLYNKNDGDLDSSRLKTDTLKSMVGARKVMDVPLKAFNEIWDHKDDGALWHKEESMEKMQIIVDSFLASPEGALACGVKMYNALGNEIKPVLGAHDAPAGSKMRDGGVKIGGPALRYV